MAVKYKLVDRKNPLDHSQPAKKYAIAVREKKVTPNQMAKVIQDKSSLTRGDIMNTMLSYSDEMKKELLNGNAIEVAGIGIFSLSLSSDGVATESDFNARTHIKGARVRFTPSKELKDAISTIEYKKL